MTNFKASANLIATRGQAILDDVAGTAAVSGDSVSDLLTEACHDMADWVCVFAALGKWDSSCMEDAIGNICEAAEVFAKEWAEHRLG